MTKKELDSLILAFAIIGALCFIVGIANYWFMAGSLIFGCAAAVTKLFEQTAK